MWSGGDENRLYSCCGGRGDVKKALVRFTITAKYQGSGKGYIIMEIMSTHVTNNTRYRVIF